MSDKWPEKTVLPTWRDRPIDEKTGQPIPGKKGKGQTEIASACGSLFSLMFRIIMILIFLSLFIPLFMRDIDTVLQTDTLGPIAPRYAENIAETDNNATYIQ